MASIDETKKRLVHRRLASELNSTGQRRNAQTKSPEELDQALIKLTELAKDKVKAEEFTTSDKQSLLEIFVTNEQVWLQMHDIIFPSPATKGSLGVRKVSSELQNHR